MAISNKRDMLPYMLLESRVDPNFWHKLIEIKLDVDKLDEKPHKLWAVYQMGSSLLDVDCASFNSEFPGSSITSAAFGTLINKNTIEGFDATDKMLLLQKMGEEMLETIENRRALCNPSLLSKFFILSYADLKRYTFRYWFAFPTISGGSLIRIGQPIRLLKDVFSSEQCDNMCQLFLNLNDWRLRNAFIACITGNEIKSHPLVHISDIIPKWTDSLDGAYLVIVDPCHSDAGASYIVRNILLMLAMCFPDLTYCGLRVIFWRMQVLGWGDITVDNSLLLEVVLDPAILKLDKFSLRWTGWESNSRGKLLPRKLRLNSFMDPRRLAETAVDMNLKLMKWRLVPELNLDTVKNTRCLLLGAGTLGCSVARVLLGWGVRKITLVDNGVVSFSNPVRQSLYDHEDCLDSGKPKAEVAAEHLRRIFPGVNARGVNMCIPMPGHTVGYSEKELLDNIELLETLFQSHDVAFLLTDSRESRWLPTLLGIAKGKFTICAALGFDTFLVMRHNVPSLEDPVLASEELGCYYCSDVVVPGNSQIDRTLDQQCTVTRPGLSAITAGIAVELMVSVLQHPLKGRAPAVCSDSLGNESLLGYVPHTVRCQMSQFNMITPTTSRFINCIACSASIVTEYLTHGSTFILKALYDPSYLKEVSGLSKLCAETENVEVIMMSDSDSDVE